MATSMLVSVVEEDLEDEESMETFIVNGKPVFVKKGLNPKTVLAIYCQENNLEFPVFSVSVKNENDPEWTTFKALFELEGKSVINLFLSGESSSQAEKQVSSSKKSIRPQQTAKQNRRFEKFLGKKDQEKQVQLRNRKPELT